MAGVGTGCLVLLCASEPNMSEVGSEGMKGHGQKLHFLWSPSSLLILLFMVYSTILATIFCSHPLTYTGTHTCTHNTHTQTHTQS